MCFSAPASFTASVVLSSIGMLCLAKNQKRERVLFAAIPLLFGIQQLFEGIVWMTIREVGNEGILNFAKYGFLFFAFLIWPTWIPLSTYCMEPVKKRRRILIWFLAAGLLLSSYYIFLFLLYPVNVGIAEHSIRYTADIEPYERVYFASVLLPLFISSNRAVNLFGILCLCALFVAYLIFYYAFVSVWCFFAALISIAVYRVVSTERAVPTN